MKVGCGEAIRSRISRTVTIAFGTSLAPFDLARAGYGTATTHGDEARATLPLDGYAATLDAIRLHDSAHLRHISMHCFIN